MNIILADIMKKNDFNAGSKARNDVRDILSKNGFSTHVVFNRNHNGALKAAELVLSMNKLRSKVSAGDVVVLQYPYNINIAKKITEFLTKVKKSRDIRIVYVLHDVYYIRGDQAADADMLRTEEVNIFNSVDCIIVHNEKMMSRLQSDGVTAKMVPLGLFDYLTDVKAAEGSGGNGITVDFAGNLAAEKSGFLYSLGSVEGVRFNLYGVGYNGDQSNVNYPGSFPPEQLVGSLTGDYGLVWDGKSVDECDGSYGNYLRYNNPHKLSLYLAAEKPVIVWGESALAEFVAQNGVGRCVYSISELSSLPTRSTREYEEMKENVRRLSVRLRSGDFLLSALRQAMSPERS